MLKQSHAFTQDVNFSMESDMSADEDEPEKCNICDSGGDLLGHLEDSFSCLKTRAMELLPRHWWEQFYMNDAPFALLDMSIRLRLCLNTGSCPLPRGNTVRNWPKHMEESFLCFKFYRNHPAVVEHLVKGIAQDVNQLTNKMAPRRSNLIRTQIDGERTGIAGFEARISREMCEECGQCGMLGPVGERLKLAKTGERGVLACKDCLDDDEAFRVQPKSLADRRAAVYRASRGELDHLVALRAEHHDGHVLFPANVASRRAQEWVTEGRMEEEHFTVVVPTSVTAIKVLNEAARRASDEWTTGLKALLLETESPRTILVTDFLMFLQAVSALQRTKLAEFNRSVIHLAEQLGNAATAVIVDRSPQKRIRASYRRVNFDDCMPGAMAETFDWSDDAVSKRTGQSEARRAWNGSVKTSVEVRILADEPVNWSQTLKAIFAKTFERDVIESVEGIQTLTCAGGCTPTSCNNVHPHLDKFLEENMVGLARLARIPVVLNYLKVAVTAFEKAILMPDCRQWDFNLKFEKKGWNVSLVGSMWTKKRASLNDKIATKTRIKTDLDIVKRILSRPEDLETVSMDQGHLQNR